MNVKSILSIVYNILNPYLFPIEFFFFPNGEILNKNLIFSIPSLASMAWKKLKVKRLKRQIDKSSEIMKGDEPVEELESKKEMNERLVYLNVLYEAGKPESEEAMNDKMLNKALIHGHIQVRKNNETQNLSKKKIL
jgi:hypothetical protein